MELTVISEENKHWFRPILLPEVYPELCSPGHLALGAVSAGVPVGALCVEAENGMANFLSLCVSPSKRRQGVATALLHQLETLNYILHVEQWQAVYQAPAPALDGFFQASGFRQEEETPAYSFRLGDAASVPVLQTGGDQKQIVPVRDVPPGYLRSYNRTAGQSTGLPVDWSRVDRDVSMVLLEDRSVAGLLALDQGESPVLSMLYVTQENSRAILTLLRRSLAEAQKKYPPTTVIRVATVTEAAEKILQKILGDKLKQSGGLHTAVRDL